MTVLAHTSLCDQVSKKMSAWILILVTAIIVSLFFVSYVLSRQMFLKQVNNWSIIAPQQAITNLIDSDHFSIKREVEFLKSTGLFASFVITDNQQQVIAFFGENKLDRDNFIPIQDEARVIWGYYYFKPNFYRFFSPFLISSGIFLALILMLYFLIRWRIRLNLELEFSRFNQFLSEVDLVTEKLNEIYNEEDELAMNTQLACSSEQFIINRTVSRLVNEIRKANRSLRDAISSAEKKRFHEELTRTALQVVHDIGSPLAALETIVQSTILGVSEESRVAIRSAAARIRDIANSLLRKAKNDLLPCEQNVFSPQLLLCVIKQVVSEKRLQYSSNKLMNIKFEFDSSSYGLFALLRVSDFSRILSNLINNAIESLNSTGDVSIVLRQSENEVIIQIKDNGKGISSEVLDKLGMLGATYGKSNGLGLGLHHAKNTIETWGGRLDMQSQVDAGTSVLIHLPKAQPPSWFVPEVKVLDKQTVIIIDDDESIHMVWRERFRHLQSVKLLHFYSPDELIFWVQTDSTNYGNILYLCDYEFVDAVENGIDLITKLRINYLSTLVTSRFDMDDVIVRCEAANIKLLPKDMASLVPVNAY